MHFPTWEELWKPFFLTAFQLVRYSLIWFDYNSLILIRSRAWVGVLLWPPSVSLELLRDRPLGFPCKNCTSPALCLVSNVSRPFSGQKMKTEWYHWERKTGFLDYLLKNASRELFLRMFFKSVYPYTASNPMPLSCHLYWFLSAACILYWVHFYHTGNMD